LGTRVCWLSLAGRTLVITPLAANNFEMTVRMESPLTRRLGGHGRGRGSARGRRLSLRMDCRHPSGVEWVHKLASNHLQVRISKTRLRVDIRR